MKSDIELIDAQRTAWVDAINAGDVERFVAVVAEDAVWLPAGQTAIVGKDSLRKWLAAPFSKYDYRYAVYDVRLRVLNDWAIERGRFRTEAVTKDGEEAPVHKGEYTLVWRREPDAWLIDRYLDHTGEQGGRLE